jgi:hypothetical protein
MWTDLGGVRWRWWARAGRAPAAPDPADMGADWGMELSLAALELSRTGPASSPPQMDPPTRLESR